MARKKPRSTKEFHKLLKHETATVRLENGASAVGTVLAIDKDYGDVILETPDGKLVLIPLGSYSFIELAKANEPPPDTELPVEDLDQPPES